MRKPSLLVLSGGVVLLALILTQTGGKRPAQADEPGGKRDAIPEKGQRGKEFIAAFNRGDAKAVAGFWTPEGDYTDEDGRKYKGRAALEKLYEKLFAANKGAKLTITVTSARQVTPDVVLEEGFTEVTPADGGPPAASAFAAVLVKKDGVWYLESVRDTIPQPPSHADHFADLEWLIGDWAGEEKGESGTASYHWEENHNFIVCSFATTVGGVPVVGGTQWIAWDAVDKQIRSWSFYSGGGFGEAQWSKDGNRWIIKTTARTADGRKVSVTNVLTKVDANHLTWQATKLTVDGKTQPDAAPLKLKRVQGEKP